MHVLHISSARTWRGGEQQIAYLLDGCHDQGIVFTLLAPLGSPLANHAAEQGWSCETYTKRAGVDPLVSRRIARLVRRLQVDGIHIHDSHSHTYVYHAYRWFGCRIPSVVTRRVTFAIKTIRKYVHSSVRSVICISQAVADQVISQGIPAAKTRIVYDGIEVDREVYPLDVQEQLGLDPNTKILVCVAALAPRKGHLYLIAALREYIETYDSSIHLVMVGGDAGELSSIRAALQAQELLDYVSLVGHQQDPWSWLSSSDLAVFASEQEGLGTSVLDAMALGIPVVSTTAGGLAETVLDGETALVAELVDASQMAQQWHTVLSDDGLRQHLVDRARKFVKQYSVERMVSKNIEEYRSAFLYE